MSDSRALRLACSSSCDALARCAVGYAVAGAQAEIRFSKQGRFMVGRVTTRHLFIQPHTIIHEFGARCYLRCVWRTLTAHRSVTFLECVPTADGDDVDSDRATLPPGPV